MTHHSQFSTNHVGVFEGLGKFDKPKVVGKRSSDIAHVHRSTHYTIENDVVDRLMQSHYKENFRDHQWFETKRVHAVRESNIPLKCQTDSRDKYLTETKRELKRFKLEDSLSVWPSQAIKDAMVYPKIQFEVPGQKDEFASTIHSNFTIPDQECFSNKSSSGFWEKRPHYNFISNEYHVDPLSKQTIALPPKPENFRLHGANWSTIHFIGRRDPIIGVQDGCQGMARFSN
eukprot:GDKJ01056525.1.p1 GENE.GDKJ01056525.1~~GDKJ01056525.1.p1  ORF type:complete len:230 (+),score=20.47 GDKJ01056525.1:12-701(+)